MQISINSLGQYLLSRKVGWLEALPLVLWGLNDLPRAVAPYSTHQLVFERHPIGVGDLPPVVDSEGCEDATQFFKKVAAERELVQEGLEGIHKTQLDKFLKEGPPSGFVAGDRVWVRNQDEEREKLGRVWQGPAEIIDKISDSVYQVNHNGVEQDLSVERWKPFVKLHDGRQPQLLYYAARCEIHDDLYMVERVDKHEWCGKRANGHEKTCPPTFSRCQALVVCYVSRSCPPEMAPR